MFFGVFLLAGIAIGYVTVKDLRMAMESESWPTVDGVVTKSRLQSGGRRGGGHFLQYRYDVQGERFFGQRKTFRVGPLKYTRTENLRRFPVGQIVAVSYAPDDPSIAVLDTTIHWSGLLFHIFGAALVGSIGAGGVYLAFRQ